MVFVLPGGLGQVGAGPPRSWYVEYSLDFATTTYISFGLVDASQVLTDICGDDVASLGNTNGGVHYVLVSGGVNVGVSTVPVTQGDVVGFALALSAGSIYAHVNGQWWGHGPPADFGFGTDQVIAVNVGTTLFPMVTVGNGDQITMVASPAYMPAGYKNWPGTFSPTDKAAAVSLSNGNLTAKGTGSLAGVRGTMGKTR
jgi:hypothetical protein